MEELSKNIDSADAKGVKNPENQSAAAKQAAVKQAQTDEIRELKLAIKEEQKARANAEKALEKMRIEFERERAKIAKGHDIAIDRAKKEVERAAARQQRAERVAIEKTNIASERSRTLASLRMELTRERMKTPQAIPASGAVSPAHTTASITAVPQTFGLDPVVAAQIQQILELMRMRASATAISPVQNIAQPASASTVDMDAFSRLMKIQQDAMAAQMATMQAQHQAQIDELVRQQQNTAQELTRKQDYTERELRRQQEYIEARHDLKAEKEGFDEEINKEDDLEDDSEGDAEQSAHNPSVDEVADSLINALESRGNIAPSSSIFLKEVEPAGGIESGVQSAESVTSAEDADNTDNLQSVGEVESMEDSKVFDDVQSADMPQAKETFTSWAEETEPAKEDAASLSGKDKNNENWGIQADSEIDNTSNLGSTDEIVGTDNVGSADGGVASDVGSGTGWVPEEQPSERKDLEAHVHDVDKPITSEDKEKDPLDDLIANLNRELDELKSQLDGGKKKRK